VTFGTVIQIGRLHIEFLKNPDGGGCHLENQKESRYLRTTNTKFGTVMQNGSLISV